MKGRYATLRNEKSNNGEGVEGEGGVQLNGTVMTLDWSRIKIICPIFWLSWLVRRPSSTIGIGMLESLFSYFH
jgi:hypothetical protein